MEAMLVTGYERSRLATGEDLTMETVPDGELLRRLDALPDPAASLLARLREEEGIWLVGGAPRDLLLGLEPRELDLVVEGDAIELARRLGCAQRAHPRFGTATVIVDGLTVDIARARRERYAAPGALPDVEPASLAEDLRRRDFTVNALAVALGGRRRGELAAVPGAREDLRGGLLRVLHDRSFIDDPTRLLRLARYAARLGFAPEADTAALVDAALADGVLGTVSGARLGAELRLLAREQDPVAAFAALRRLGLDGAIAPGLGLRDAALARDALALLGGTGRPEVLVPGLALSGLEPAAVIPLLDQLAWPAAERDAVAAVATRAAPLARELEAAAAPRDIAAAAAGLPAEAVAAAGALGPRAQATAWIWQLRAVELEISGADLVAAGVRPGPQVGAGLRAALEAKLDGRLAGREEELAAALRAAQAAPRRG